MNAALFRGRPGPGAETNPSWRTRSKRLLAEHWVFATVLGVGALARAVATATYWPAFWFFDGGRYIDVSRDWAPDDQRPFGYSAALRLFDWTGTLASVTIAQHVVGLALALALYRFLLHRGVAKWLAVMGAAPVALDAYQIALEQYILAETLFTTLLLGALLLLLWRPRPGLWAVAGVGVLFAAAGLTRTVGLPLIGLVVLYFLVRRLGWRCLVVLVVAWTIPVVGYVGWYHQHHGVYDTGQYEGRFLYGRVSTFADCDKLDLTAAERKLCPAEPVNNRYSPSFYVWNFTSPQFQYPTSDDDKIFAGFARKAILAQPGDYAYLVLWQTSGYFGFRKPPVCTGDWEMPDTRRTHCHPKMSGNDGFDTAMKSPGYREPNAFTAIMASYQHYVYFPGMLWAVFIVMAVWAASASAVSRLRAPPEIRKTRDVRDGVDAVLLVSLGLAMLVLAVATSMFDYRYGVPTLALIPPAGALAWQQLRLRLQWGKADR